MKYALLALLSLSAYADVQCDRLHTSILDLEQGLQKAFNKEACKVPTSSEATRPNYSCMTFGELDLALAKLESKLVIVDGLVEFKNQFVQEGQNLDLTDKGNKASKGFVQDLYLGGAFQDVLLHPDLKDILQMNPATVCDTPALAKKYQFCSYLATAPEGKAEFTEFLKSLKTTEDLKTVKSDLLKALSFSSQGEESNFKALIDDVEVAGVKLGDFLSTSKASPAPKFSPEQMKFIRNLKLSSIAPAQTNKAAELAKRFNQNSSELKAKAELALLMRIQQDDSLRLWARLKSKWSLLVKNKSGRTTQCLRPEADFEACVKDEFAKMNSGDAIEERIVESITDAIKQDKERRTCSFEDYVSVFYKKPSTKACDPAKLMSEAEDLKKNRQDVLDARAKLLESKEMQKLLGLRRFAYTQAEKFCKNKDTYSEVETLASAGAGLCMNINADFSPMIQLTNSTMNLVYEGIKAESVFDWEVECPAGEQNRYAHLCELAKNDTLLDPAIQPYVRPAVTPPDIKTPEVARSNSVVIDAIASVANDLANQWGRQQNQFQPPRPLTVPTMPYVQTPFVSSSDRVMFNGITRGGFSQYYDCGINCGPSLKSQAFKNYWNLNPPAQNLSSTTGLGPMGSAISSRFFFNFGG